MEPTTNQEVITPEPSAPTDNKKEGNGLKAATIICAVLALAGIGFGVYGMMRKPVETPTEDNAAELEAELSNVKQKYAVLQNYVKELEASGTEVPEEAKSATEVEPAKVVKTEEYIYIGEYGLKLKIPETVKNVNYIYRYFDDEVATMYISARTSDDPTTDVSYPDDFTDLTHGVGIVAVSFHRDTEGCATINNPDTHCSKIVKNSNGEEIGISSSSEQAYKSESDEQHKWEEKAVGALMKMLSDDSSYSAI